MVSMVGICSFPIISLTDIILNRFTVRNDQQIVSEIAERAQMNPNIILIGTTTNNKRNSEL